MTDAIELGTHPAPPSAKLACGAGLLSVEDLHGLLERPDEGFALVDPLSGRYIHLSNAGAALLGQNAEDQLGEHSPWLIRERGAVMHMKFSGREFSYRTTEVRGAALDAIAVQFRDVTLERRRERQLRAFSVAAAASAFATTLPSVLNGLAEQVRRTARMGSCTFLLYDDDGHLHLSGTAGSYPHSTDYTDRLIECRALGAPLLSDEVVHTRRVRVESGWRRRTLEDPRFAPIHAMSEASDWDTIVVVPLQVRGTIVGVFNGFYPPGGEPEPEDIAFLTSIADHAAVAVGMFNARAALEDQVARTERGRMARDLHDTVSQLLYAVSSHAAALDAETTNRTVPEALESHIKQIRALAAEAFGSMRTLLDGVRGLAHSGALADAVMRHLALAQALGCSTELIACPAPASLPVHVEEQLLRVAQEAINNVVRHAPGAHVDVTLASDDAGWCVTIADNGPGFEVDAPALRWLGLDGMRERMQAVGGTLSIHSSTSGTTVRAQIPSAVYL
ncbi:GAF domain-containing sensor histidine kinase [Microbacterium maritypicum]|uniref:GAF domain-containing sensor histidine kinase n=1 Tax=Microbacterium maritypicum TaxID=33918 RepID=UPI00382856B4